MKQDRERLDDEAAARRVEQVADLGRRRSEWVRPPVERLTGGAADLERRRKWAALVAIVKALPFDDGVSALGRELATFDGFPSTPSPASRGAGEDDVALTMVEALAGRSLPLFRDRETIDRCLQAITLEVSRLQRVVSRWAPPEYVKMPCEVGSYHDEWALPRDGESFPCPEEMEHYDSGRPRPERLCAKHRKRKERWERARDRGEVA